jgi:hypothetical protein
MNSDCGLPERLARNFRLWRFYFYFTPPVSPVGSAEVET